MTGRQAMEEGDLSRPPAPVPGCPACTELAIRRDDARVWRDRSAETDADVLLRRHLRAAGVEDMHRQGHRADHGEAGL
ncbi:hypothetical protein OHU07_16130 [Streptomyces phaeochromogenes]